jgi:bacillopeptidase F
VRRQPVAHLGWALSGAALAAALLVSVSGLFDTEVVAGDSSTNTTVPVTATTATTPPTTAPDPVVPIVPSTTQTTVEQATTTTADTVAPLIEILSPTDGQVFEEKTITFTGITEPGARVLAGPYEASVAADGSWSIKLVLDEGENRAVFTAIDPAGNEAVAVVTPVYQPPAPVTTTTKPKPEIEAFTANATWIECSSEPPFDEYYGTGQPGSWVEVISPYGSGETIVGPDGTWYAKVIFDVPKGKRIEVKVKDQYGRVQWFPFVAVEPG